MNNINTLTNGTINGLTDLSLDTLYTTNLNSETIDGNLIYYNRIEGNEIIVDTRLTLTNTGVISVGDVLISDVELTYLDGVSSNIQTQINNINTDNNALLTTINSHTSQITALQTSDTAQNTTLATHTTQINNLDYAVTGQINSITNLQTSDTAQNTTLATHTALLDANAISLTALNNKTRNMTATSTLTTMSKPLVFNVDGETLKMSGNQSFIAGYDSSTGTRDFAFGTGGPNIKRLNIVNDKQDGIYLISGLDENNKKGRNSLSTYSNGISLYRGNTESGNTLEFSGAIGQLTPTLPHFFITGNSTNPIYIDAGLSSITLNTNTLWISGGTAAGNGRFSNINMLNAAGNNWETQSSAFTETIKAQIATNTTNIFNCQFGIGTNTTSINTLLTSLNANIAQTTTNTNNITSINNRLVMTHIKVNLTLSNIINITTLNNNTTYTSTYDFNLGLFMFNNGYSSMFYSSGLVRFNNNYLLQFSNDFNQQFALINKFRSKVILLHQPSGNSYDETNFTGIFASGAVGNVNQTQQAFTFVTEQIPINGSALFGNGMIIIRTEWNFRTSTGPYDLLGHFRFIQQPQ